MEGALIPIVVFLAVYVALTFELVNKAVAALMGVMILLVLHVVNEHQAVEFIDFETIMLLLGMMSIVAILRKAGFFSIISVRIAELTKGSPLKILILFSIVTAVLSAFLDNVTTVLIIIPIIIELTAGMGLDPKMYVISQAIISNIGGTATLIGDPPNIIIGSKVGLTFNQFMINLSLPVIVCFGAALAYIWATNIVSLCHLNNLPVYLFANTLKFSHRPSSQQKIHRKVESKIHGDVCYQLITHSHDLVDLKHVDFLVTEDGIKDKAAILEFIKAARA